MLVQCPKCKTKYKVSDEVVKDATPAFRCSRCKHTFELETPEVPEPVVRETKSPNVPPAATKEESELSFTFPLQGKEPLQGDEQKKFAESFARDVEQSAGDSEFHDRWSMNIPEPKNEEPFVISPSHGDSQEKKITQPPVRGPLEKPASQVTSAATPESSPNVYSIGPYRDQRASTAPFLTLFGLFIVFFSFAAAYHEVHPQASEGIVQKIPLVGSSVLKNNHLKEGVLLQSLQSSYQMIQGNREVFVVTGVALNQNPVVIREVRIAGQLYNQAGKEIEQQTIWIGNAISPKIVRGMTAQDISDLQRLKPLKTFEIPPGDSVPFTIVFLKPNREAKNFSCEIVSAEDAA